MASIPTLANMMLSLYTPPKDYNQALLEGQRFQAGRTGHQTALLELAELQRQVQAAELARQYQREHPETLLGQPAPGGMPTQGLGSLPTTAGPLTQTTQVPGQAPQTQTIPAYPDASRFATPPGGGPMPTDQPSLSALPTRPDPLRALVQQNPDAARLVMQQQQQAQDRALQVEEGRLKRQLTVAGAVGQILQGATDQPSYAIARERLQELAPQIAQRLPPTYSKAAVQPYLDMALDRAKTVQAQLETMQQQVETYKADVQARTALAKEQIVPKYTGDAQRDSLIHAEMQRQGLTGIPPQAVLDTVEQRIQQGKVDVSASQGAGQAQQAGQAAYNKERMTQAATMGSSAQSSLSTLQQMQTLMDEGVYGNSWGDVFNMGLYQARLNQGDQQAVRTQQLRAYGNQLIKDAAEGKLGAGVSNKDVDIFREAVGNFQRAKNLDEMRESLSQMQGAAKRMIGQANRMQQIFQSGGRLPDFGDESHVQSVSRKDFDAFVAKHPEKTRDQWRRLFTADGIVFRE